MTPDPTPQTAHRYTAEVASELELRWQRWWRERGTHRQPNPGDPRFDPTKPKFYVLDMFPYPSGAGLHVGHPEGYTATDILARYKRMRGCNVLRPMGWDAFGLPAEQYAIQTGVHPAITTRRAIDTFRRQLQRFGFSYDWDREFATIDEPYYRWTQWIFLRMYDSWFDARAARARPIADLISEFERGSRPSAFNPDAAEITREDKQRQLAAWADLDPHTRRAVVDSYRLAYVGEQTVNWCPKLGTALANEEVIDGKSERGGYPVFRKPLRQWMFRITAYADRLLNGLAGVDWPESTRTQQTEWIGRSEGAEIEFELDPEHGLQGPANKATLRVFTTRPDTIFGATYMVVAPEHPLVEAVLTQHTGADHELRTYVDAARNRSEVERQEAKEKTGVDTGVDAINPATGRRIPVWTSDYVLMGYGTGAIMAVPAQDQRDWDFATKFNLPIVRTVKPPEGFAGQAYTGDGPAINSTNAEVALDGLTVAEAKARTIDWLERRGLGTRRVNFKLHDWLFSRQRYWGEPFPIVYDEQGHHHPVHPSKLPVTLPEMADYQPIESDDPQPLLAKAEHWLRTTAGECGIADLPPDTPLRREANTMPGWAGSCWYYLRYCDPANNQRFVGPDPERYWMGEHGVDLYIGGSEHAVLHLLYARFWHQVLFDLGAVSSPEPFRKLFHQGLILSHAYQRPDRSLVPTDEVEERDGSFVERATGAPLTQVVAKMSKSLKNVVNPDDVIAQFGADTFRLYEMYMGPLEASAPWNTNDTIGLFRFLQRVWRLVIDEADGALRLAHDDARSTEVEKKLHRTINKAAGDIERLAFNTAIAAMIEFVNTAHAEGGLARDQLDRFIRVLAPFAPHIAQELWSRLGHATAIDDAPWPEVDPAMLRDDEVEIPVQILGKLRSKIIAPAEADAPTLESLALADPRIVELLEGKTVRKVVVVPGRLVNIVAN